MSNEQPVSIAEVLGSVLGPPKEGEERAGTDETRVQAPSAPGGPSRKVSALHPRPRAEVERALAVKALREQRAALTQACLLRGIPEHPDIRAVVLAQTPAASQALTILEASLEERVIEGKRYPALLAIMGEPDTGKTTAAARVVARHPQTALYIRAQMITGSGENLGGFNFEAQQEQRRLREELRRVDLLVIDEVGTEQSSEVLSELACLRFDSARVTVFLGNLSKDLFRRRFSDPRLLTRMSGRQPYLRHKFFWVTDKTMSRFSPTRKQP